jgi:hypothetical protein
MQYLLFKGNYISCDIYGKSTYSEKPGVAYVALFSQNSYGRTEELDPEKMVYAVLSKPNIRQAQYRYIKLFGSGMCAIIVGLFDDALTNRRHGVE